MRSVVLPLVVAALPAMAEPSLSEKLQTLSKLRVFFAHQSVGENVLDGLQTVADEQGVALRIEEGRGTAPFAQAGIIHAKVGKNEDPLSKLSDFAALLEEGPGGRAQVALMKLCYVDFTAGTDVQALFAAYQKRLAELKDRFPDVRFVVVTAPLTTVQRGLKAVLKNKLGSGAAGEKENVKRHQFNELLRAAYAGKLPLFDLAKLESAGCTFERGGKQWPCLRSEVTDDGGHLNAKGQRELAQAFVDAIVFAVQ